jgi:hypothetical protein
MNQQQKKGQTEEGSQQQQNFGAGTNSNNVHQA